MTGATGYAIASGIRAWMSTLRYEAIFADRRLDPAEGDIGPAIYLVWHEYMLTPLYLRAGCRVAILVSKHPDADLLEAIAKSSGFDCVRGSTNRGGVAALRQLAARGEQQHLVITPDGPRGPRRQIAAGPVYLASRLQLPIVPIAVAYDRHWRLSSWDRFAVPRPFTTGRVMLGNELQVRADLDRAGLEQRRIEIEREFLRLTDEVEAWAATRKTRLDAVPGKRERPTSEKPSETRRLAA